MALDNQETTIPELSLDIYKIAEFVESIKAKYVDIPEDTLALGMFGYFSAVFSNVIENTTTMAAEYSQEAIPTKAKFERNLIAHALALGINKIMATPAEMDVLLGFQESALISNMGSDNRITIDKDTVFGIGQDSLYPYMLDYDIIIRRDKLPNGKWVYSARYDIDGTNEMVELRTPYLPAMEQVNLEGDAVVMLKTTLRQMTHSTIVRQIIVNNPLETKIITFDFQDQLAFFYVTVVENGVTHYLKPIYDGLYDYTSKEEFINYMFLDEKNIRLSFNRDSYSPRNNSEVTIHIFTTLGKECNYKIDDEYQVTRQLTSERYSYNNLWAVIQKITDSQFGNDRLTVKQLKNVIPREALSRGVVTTYTDLNNVFNAIQDENCKLYFLEKVHNQLVRLYFSYILLKDGDNVIPTNTINPAITRSQFTGTSKSSFWIKSGGAYYIDADSGEVAGLPEPTKGQVEDYDLRTFLYMCPYLTVINKTPFYVSYYLTLVNYSRYLYFEYVNDDSLLQFITLAFSVKRELYTDPDTYKITVKSTQNINTDFQLIEYDGSGKLTQCKLRVFMVLYRINSDGEEVPVRYCEGNLVDFGEINTDFTFEFRFTTDDQITAQGTYIQITSGLNAIGTDSNVPYAAPHNMKMKLFYLAELDTRPPKGRVYGYNEQLSFDDLVPDMEDYTLTNVYSAGKDGLDIFYDYSDINQSFIELEADSTGASTSIPNYQIYKVPVVRYTYLNTEERVASFLEKVDQKRRLMEHIMPLLENSFGIDYKFFNTYGPSIMYNIERKENIDRINLSLTFEVKFQIPNAEAYIPLIVNSVKRYIEDLNYVSDLHIPNLITYITNTYREQLVYFKFIKLNDYGSLYQSVYKNPMIDGDYFVETQTVPEFINVTTLSNDLPDIQFKIVTDD